MQDIARVQSRRASSPTLLGLGTALLCLAAVVLREHHLGATGVVADALLGENGGGGQMSKGLGAQAHDLGWDGGEDYQSSGVTYSKLPVSSGPSILVHGWLPSGNLETPQGRLQSAIDTGLKVAWDNLAMTSRRHGCDAACLRDIYRRAFRARRHLKKQRKGEQHALPMAEQRDNLLFGQTPSEIDVSPASFSEAYRDVSSIGVKAAPAVLRMLSTYLPQAVSAEKQLDRAIAEVRTLARRVPCSVSTYTI